MKISIPKGLLYYKYFPMWKVFFEELGFDVMTSRDTSKKIMESGLKIANDELCLPVKIFHGHVADVKDKSNYIFIPRVINMRKGKNFFTCPKLMGLPDMIKGCFDDISHRLLEPDINLAKEPLEKTFIKLGKKLGEKEKAKKAIKRAMKAQKDFEKLLEKGYMFEEALNILFKGEKVKRRERRFKKRVGIIGHSYIVFDKFLNLNLFEKLEKLEVDYITMYNLPFSFLDFEDDYWNVAWVYEREIIGAVKYFIEKEKVDGIIYLLSFGCGTAIVVREIIMRDVIKGANIPFLPLILDEHTGEAGFMTRLESFCDILKK